MAYFRVSLYVIIYKVTNKLNGKIYIGQTRLSLRERWLKHIYRASCQTNRNHAICAAIRKYGKDAFIVEQIDSAVCLEELNRKELYWAAKLNSYAPSGYNLALCGNVNKKHELTIDKISKTYKFLSPTNELVIIKNLKRFSEKHMLDFCHMYKVHTGQRKSHRGWRCASNSNIVYIFQNVLSKDTEAVNDSEYGSVERFVKNKMSLTGYYHLIRGRCKIFKGWALLRTETFESAIPPTV